MQKIVTFLTFDSAAEQAVEFYTSIFPGSKVVSTSRHADKFFSATFELYGQRFIALNGGPHFTFSQGVSLFVNCETQAEVDELWHRLGAGGKEMPCGWLADRFGVVWQIVPTALGKMLTDSDPARAGRVMKAMLGMQKIDIAGLEAAYRS